jgi:transcriptional regulator with XRE-family HTH domain
MSQIIDDDVDHLAHRLGGRIRTERERRRWSLADLAAASGVSRAMINRVERGESSPTATVLGKLSAAFRISVSTLLARAEAEDDAAAARVRRAVDVTAWRDAETGYSRRPVTRPGFPVDVTEVDLPAGATVPYPAAAFAFVHQVIWVLDGRLSFDEGDLRHDLAAGDCLELGEPAPCVYRNATDRPCRYVVVLTRRDR